MRLSLDLVRAMLNQHEYIHTMVTEIAPRWKRPIGSNFPGIIRGYHNFPLLLKIQNNAEKQNTILPTWEIDKQTKEKIKPSRTYTKIIKK